MTSFEINTSERIRAFFTQLAGESGRGLNNVEIASGKNYEFRASLGNIHEGDGPKFKGVGYIQVTGRNAYQLFADTYHPDDPYIMESGVEYVADHYSFEISCFWWRIANANRFVSTENETRKITMKAYCWDENSINYNELSENAWDRRFTAYDELSQILLFE